MNITVVEPEDGRDNELLVEAIAQRLTGRNIAPTDEPGAGIFPPSGDKAGTVGGE